MSPFTKAKGPLIDCTHLLVILILVGPQNLGFHSLFHLLREMFAGLLISRKAQSLKCLFGDRVRVEGYLNVPVVWSHLTPERPWEGILRQSIQTWAIWFGDWGNASTLVNGGIEGMLGALPQLFSFILEKKPWQRLDDNAGGTLSELAREQVGRKASTAWWNPIKWPQERAHF